MLTLNAVRVEAANEPDLERPLNRQSPKGSALTRLPRQQKAAGGVSRPEERYALAIAGAGDGLWDWDRRAGVIYFSPRWKSLLGYGEAEIGDHPDEWLERTHPEDLGRLEQQLEDHWRGRSPRVHVEHRLRHKDGSYRWMLCRATTAGAGRMVGLLTDIDECKQREEQLQHAALHDGLTGLPNRSLLLDRLRRALQRLQRTPGRRFAVLFIDLDDFKAINDRFGHSAGDALLVDCARRLADFSRPVDTLARLGGDEFVLLLDGTTTLVDALRVVDRIRARLIEPFEVGGHELAVSASIGIAIGGPGCHSPEDLLHAADTAMYRAKAEGKGGSRRFDPAPRAGAVNTR